MQQRLFFLACVAAVMLPSAASGDEALSSWKAAAGAVVITPEESMWMGRVCRRDRPSEGKIHDLFAKVLVVEDAQGTRLAIVTTDLIGITPELRAGVERIVSQSGIPPQSLLMNASHTHCGPELRGGRLVRFGIGSEYAAQSTQYVRGLAAKIGALVESTCAQLQPARLIYSRARAGFAMNRRLPAPHGFINSPNPDGPVDHDVPVLRVESDGDLKAVLFGYACHATTLSFYQLCGDYPGFAQQYIEAQHPGAVALFLNGCSGDQNPYPRRTLELAQQHGRALANGVETALQTKRVREIHGPLRVALETTTLKFAPAPTRDALEQSAQSSNKYKRFHAEALLEQLELHGNIPIEYPSFPLQAVQFGDDLTLVAICGEVVVDYALRLKRELAVNSSSTLWVAGYSNYVFGYLPSRRVLREGGYEGGGAMRYTTFPGPFDESVEDRIVAKIVELVAHVRGPTSPSE